jgi:hypothetical protein
MTRSSSEKRLAGVNGDTGRVRPSRPVRGVSLTRFRGRLRRQLLVGGCERPDRVVGSGTVVQDRSGACLGRNHEAHHMVRVVVEGSVNSPVILPIPPLWWLGGVYERRGNSPQTPVRMTRARHSPGNPASSARP